MENKEVNKEDIKKYFTFLDYDECIELRLIKPELDGKKESPRSFFVKEENEILKVIDEYNGEWNIYVGINSRETKGKSDDDVKFITNIGHDIDAHEGGDEALFEAGQVALKIVETAKELGYQEPMIINSGHGYWVIHHIAPIENTPDNIKRIKEFGKKIKERYETEKIILDSTVYNPSRIARVPGTLNLREMENKVLASIMNNPTGDEDLKLRDAILDIEIKTYQPNSISSIQTTTPSINSFMDYCLTHEIPTGERHSVISRHIALYISDHPDRELLREQYFKIQKGSETELDQWLKNIDENGKAKYPFSIGQLVNFTKKYKIPFDWKLTPEYKQWKAELRAETNLQKEINNENRANEFDKAIKFFLDKKDLARKFLEVQPLYFDDSKMWWKWNHEELFWKMCDETDIMNSISKHSEANTINSTEKSEILEALKQQSRLNKPLDVKTTWIQFKDKIFDIHNGETIEVSSKYFVTNPIPWNLGESEETPHMDEIFTEWVGGDKKKTLYEILAYCLLTDYPIHRIFCFIGGGMNGKSKYLDVIRKFIGNNNCTSTELDTLISSRFEVSRLHKKLVCQMGETNFGELTKTSMLKKLSGGDLIGFEYKRKDPFEEKNYAKILIATNNLTSTTDKTVGFYRRWMIIDFPNQFDEKKDILKDIPDQEYINLGRKCCRLLTELLEKREFHEEGSIEQRMEVYESKSNFLELFIKQFTREDLSSHITKAEFYRKFKQWYVENRHREMSESSVGLTMKKLNIESGRESFQWMNDGKGGQARVWRGLKWLNE